METTVAEDYKYKRKMNNIHPQKKSVRFFIKHFFCIRTSICNVNNEQNEKIIFLQRQKI